MRTRKEYKKNKKSVKIWEHPAKITFNFLALVPLESEVVRELYRQSLLSNYEIKEALDEMKIKFSYTTLRRTLEDLFVLGWVGKRKVRSRTLYYLTAETRKKLEEQVPDRNWLLFNTSGAIRYGDEIQPKKGQTIVAGPAIQLNPDTKFKGNCKALAT